MECKGIPTYNRKRVTMTQPMSAGQIREMRDDYILETLNSQIEELGELADKVKQGLAAWIHPPNDEDHDTLPLEQLLTYISTLSQLVEPFFLYAVDNAGDEARYALVGSALEILASRPPVTAELEEALHVYKKAAALQREANRLETWELRKALREAEKAEEIV